MPPWALRVLRNDLTGTVSDQVTLRACNALPGGQGVAMLKENRASVPCAVLSSVGDDGSDAGASAASCCAGLPSAFFNARSVTNRQLCGAPQRIIAGRPEIPQAGTSTASSGNRMVLSLVPFSGFGREGTAVPEGLLAEASKSRAL